MTITTYRADALQPIGVTLSPLREDGPLVAKLPRVAARSGQPTLIRSLTCSLMGLPPAGSIGHMR